MSLTAWVDRDALAAFRARAKADGLDVATALSQALADYAARGEAVEAKPEAAPPDETAPQNTKHRLQRDPEGGWLVLVGETVAGAVRRDLSAGVRTLAWTSYPRRSGAPASHATRALAVARVLDYAPTSRTDP